MIIIAFSSVVIGDQTRKWNEGENYQDSKEVYGKTFLTGFIIVAFLVLNYPCSNG